LLGYRHSEESLTKMSLALSGDNNPMFGRTGENHPNYGKIFSAETLLKISKAKGGGSIYVNDTQGTLVNCFSSARNAAKNFNTFHPTIVRYVKDNKLFQDKWYLSYSKNFLLESTPKGSKDSESNS